jgi:hypothetical protein
LEEGDVSGVDVAPAAWKVTVPEIDFEDEAADACISVFVVARAF